MDFAVLITVTAVLIAILQLSLIKVVYTEIITIINAYMDLTMDMPLLNQIVATTVAAQVKKTTAVNL